MTPIKSLVPILLAACGHVVEPASDPRDPVASTDAAIDIGDDGPSIASPILIEALHASTGPRALFAQSFGAQSPLSPVVLAAKPYEIVEQRIVTKTADEVQLVVELAVPTGTYARTLVSDGYLAYTETNHVLCETGNIATFDPRCETAQPAAVEMPFDGAMTSATWSVIVIDELTNATLTGCVTAANRTTCVLPPKASASYRIVVSGAGFADLWNSTPNLGEFVVQGIGISGAYNTPVYQCWDWHVSGTALYCAVRYAYARFTAIDRARIDFDPIALTITADAFTTTMTSPALVWDAGEKDLPGIY